MEPFSKSTYLDTSGVQATVCKNPIYVETAARTLSSPTRLYLRSADNSPRHPFLIPVDTCLQVVLRRCLFSYVTALEFVDCAQTALLVKCKPSDVGCRLITSKSSTADRRQAVSGQPLGRRGHDDDSARRQPY
ncbi:hypothetical protein J6590_004200 [Homalodisca vitripennis]|nr:hypothetical protein J6590_004200 [Homalodisca vitripennis]